MKKLGLNLKGLSVACLLAGNCLAEEPFPDALEGSYMGQKPPGLVAEVFAPGIVSTEGWEVEGVFAPGMKEFYFVKENKDTNQRVTVGYRQIDNHWKQFAELKRTGEVAFAPDGSRLYMAKGFRERVGEEWSEPQSLGPLIDNKAYGIMRLSASSRATYVFDDYLTDQLRISTQTDGRRNEPQLMNDNINTGKWTAHPFIAPDESYLIWDSEREEGFGSTDLYISFRAEDGSWGKAINMGAAVNSDKGEMLASVTPDGKFIVFNRKADTEGDNWDIYWVDATIIEQLRINQN